MIGLRRAISLAGLERNADLPWSGTPRRALDWALETGAKGVQIDATMNGLRARDLDQSARRDLAAVLRRAGAACSGLDLWIPQNHFADAANQGRAVDAVHDACGLAADLRRLGVIEDVPSISIATLAETPAGVIDRLALTAEHLGVRIADHRWPNAPAHPIGVGIDPAAILMAGGEPSSVVTKLREPPASARLSDASAIGRCVPGRGRLKLDEYDVALTIVGYAGWLIADLRGIPNQADAAAELMGGTG